jgi:hypothetical protein
MIRQDLLKGKACQVHPSGICAKLKAEDVFGVTHGLAVVLIKRIFGR